MSQLYRTCFTSLYLFVYLFIYFCFGETGFLCAALQLFLELALDQVNLELPASASQVHHPAGRTNFYCLQLMVWTCVAHSAFFLFLVLISCFTLDVVLRISVLQKVQNKSQKVLCEKKTQSERVQSLRILLRCVFRLWSILALIFS